MPELPEVETIKLGLQKKIVGLTIKDIEILSPKTFIGDPKELHSKKVLSIWRKAKILGLDLGNLSLLIHLKMSGQLVYDSRMTKVQSLESRFVGGHPTPDMRQEMPNKTTRVIFTFSDNSKLYFNDQRRFGWIKVIKEVGDLFKKLGPEPLEKDFTWQVLKNNLLRHKSMPVKVALMDQSVVSGVGNIYANEACFNAKIDPRIKVKDLTDEQFESLYRGAIKSLLDGIKYGGSSRAHFVDAEGHKGYFLDYAFVYWRHSKPCKVCKTEIKKIQLGGRGTYLCPNCQKAL